MAAPATARGLTQPPCLHASAGPASSECSPRGQFWVLFATILGSSMAFMDGTVVNVALPKLQATFSASAAGVQWIVQSYALFTAALLLVGGTLGDRYGRRLTYVMGVVIFAVGSVACGLSTSLTQLIAARSVQGIGGALLIPQSLAIISASFAEEQRGRAIGTWSAWSGVFSAIGPVAGGWLVQHWSWRWIFFLNIPFAVMILLTARRIPESRAEQEPERLDVAGATLVTLGLGAVIYALSIAPEAGWGAPRTWATLTAGMALLIGFVWVEATSASAMMPLTLFRSRAFSAANLLTLLLYGGLGASLYFIPFFLIQVLGYSPSAAGAVFLPLIAIMFTLSSWAGSLVSRYGPRLPLIAGPCIAGLGFVLFGMLQASAAASWATYFRTVFPAVVVLGLGMTLTVSPLTTVVMNAVPREKTGVASGVNNAVSRVAALLSIAIFGLVLSLGFSAALGSELKQSQLPQKVQSYAMQNRTRLKGIAVPGDILPEQQKEFTQVLSRAFRYGFREVMLLCAGCAWAGAGVVFLMLRKENA